MTYPWAAGEVLTAADLNAYAGLIFITSQSVVGSPTSVTLSNVFSATYDNYVVVLSNIDCNTDAAGIKIKFSGTAGSTYSAAGYFMEYTSGTINGSYYNLDANGVSIGLTSTNNDISLASQVFNPFLTQYTTVTSQNAGTNYVTNFSGIDKNAASHTGFTIDPDGAATLTGGTIKVYGYHN